MRSYNDDQLRTIVERDHYPDEPIHQIWMEYQHQRDLAAYWRGKFEASEDQRIRLQRDITELTVEMAAK